MKQKRVTRKPAKQTRNRTVKTTFDLEMTYRTDLQRDAYEVYKNNDVVIFSGPAGTGKTHLAMMFAIRDVLKRSVDHIVMTRPVVEAGESLGFLPGDFHEKVQPYMIPMLDCLKAILPSESMRLHFTNSTLITAPVAYMRGRTFNDSVCIFDEAQNATEMQLKLFLTRCGSNAKMVLTGDPQQSDLRDSGFVNVVRKLKGLQGVGIVDFPASDIVRHPLISQILKRLENDK